MTPDNIMKILTDLLIFEHNEFLTELDGNLLEMADAIDSYFHVNEPDLMTVVDGDVHWLDLAVWVQDSKKEMGVWVYD